MFQIIFVEWHAVFCLADFHPFRHPFRCVIAFLEKENVGSNFRAGIGGKSVVWQANSPQQVRFSGEHFPYPAVLLVHRAFAGDKSHDTARTYFVKRLVDEIVVDQKILTFIALIQDFVFPERHIANGQVKEIIGIAGVFKAVNGNVSSLVKLSGNPSGQSVQFHSIERWKQSKKVSNAAGRLQDISWLVIHSPNGVINCVDDRRTGIMRIQDCASR